jgi:hypothetical protein
MARTRIPFGRVPEVQRDIGAGIMNNTGTIAGLTADLRILRAEYAKRNLWSEARVVDLILNKIVAPYAEDEETDE